MTPPPSRLIEGKYIVVVIEQRVRTAATKHILDIEYNYHYQNGTHDQMKKILEQMYLKYMQIV